MNCKTILALACSIFSSVGLAAEKTPAQKTAEWETYINAYQPDYSDSSKYLLPPLKMLHLLRAIHSRS